MLTEVGKQSLVQSAQSGDLAAFNNLVTLHQDSLYWWAYSLVKDEALAADITQATFITAYQKLGSFRGESIRAWLFRIARNRSIDELRKLKRHPSFSLDGARTNDGQGEDDLNFLSILPDRAPLPEEALEARERAQLIEQLIARLPDAFQQVLRLVDMEGLDYQQAAEVLDLPLGTIKSRLTRARLKMRSMLQQSML